VTDGHFTAAVIFGETNDVLLGIGSEVILVDYNKGSQGRVDAYASDGVHLRRRGISYGHSVLEKGQAVLVEGGRAIENLRHPRGAQLQL
jgi:hypothetical protein